MRVRIILVCNMVILRCESGLAHHFFVLSLCEGILIGVYFDSSVRGYPHCIFLSVRGYPHCIF